MGNALYVRVCNNAREHVATRLNNTSDTSNALHETLVRAVPITLLSALGAGAAFGQASDSIFTDGFEAPTIRVTAGDATAVEGDDGTRDLSFPITLSRAPSADLSIDYSTVDESASSLDDYLTTSGTLNFVAGQTEAQVAVPVVGDICVEPDEQLSLQLSDLVGDAVFARDRASGTIATDDELPQATVSGATLIEGNAGTSELQFRIALDKFSCTDVALDYATADVEATAPGDYQPLSATLPIPAGATEFTVDATINGDICVEPHETFALNLSNPSGDIAIGLSSALATIENDDPLPILDIAPVAVNEGASGLTQVPFGLSLDRPSCTDTTIEFNTVDLTATAGDDYTAAFAPFVIPAFQTTAEIIVDATGDTDIEDNETFNVVLQSATPDIALGIASATGTLVNDDFFSGSGGPVLNDTGVTGCSDGASTGLACNSAADGTDNYPRQDAEYGRDLMFDNPADGVAGFEFVKLDANGVPLANQSGDYTQSPWNCVRDAVTGLTWEVKTNDDSLNGASWIYSWFNSTGFDDGGNAGSANGGVCHLSGDCDTESYISAVNDAGLCGFSNWRLPSRSELLSLVHYGATTAPTIDTDYFPNTAVNGLYWSSSWRLPATAVRVIDFASGRAQDRPHTDAHRIRLVRGAAQ